MAKNTPTVNLSARDLRRMVPMDRLLRRQPNSVIQFEIHVKRGSKTTYAVAYSWSGLADRVGHERDKGRCRITIYPMAAYKPTVLNF